MKRRLDTAFVLGMLANLADEILEGESLPVMDEYQRREVARLVLSRVHDVQQLDPEALPDCPKCRNSGAVDVPTYDCEDRVSGKRTVACSCGAPMVSPAGGDR